MSVLYLDYNVIASIGGVSSQPDAAAECAALRALQRQRVRVALSAWTAYELGRSTDAEHVRRCCDFVDALNPLWVSSARHVIQREIARFLTLYTNYGTTRGLPTVRALNETIGQMWSTYGVHIAGGETFRGCVQALQSDPKNLQTIVAAAEITQQAITVAREAHADGRAVTLQPVVDRETFAKRLSCRSQDERIDYLIEYESRLYKESPMLAIEDALSRVRARDSFVPKISHAADFQHAMAALAYCDDFVTRDGQLRQHCQIVTRDLGLPCRVHARVGEVTVVDWALRRFK